MDHIPRYRMMLGRLPAAWWIFILLPLFVSPGFCTETATPATGQQHTSVIESIAVEIDSPYEHRSLAEMVKALLRLKAGGPFSEALMQQSIEALQQSGLFTAIDVDTTPPSRPFELTFRLTPVRRIKDIRIHDAYPLFEKEVLKVMSLRSGDVYSESVVQQQAEPIAALYRREGFSDPRIQTASQTDPADGHVILEVLIQPGQYQKLSRISMYINGQSAEEKLAYRLKTWRQSRLPGLSGRFTSAQLKEDTDSLIRYFRKKGFPDVIVQSGVDKAGEDQSGRIHLHIDIQTGPEYDILFVGNNAMTSSKLKKSLTVFTKGNVNDLELRKSIRNIKSRYRQAGYLKARIQMSDESLVIENRPVRRISLHINEGPQTTVEDISIRGNHRFDDQSIQKQMLTRSTDNTPYVPEVLDEDLSAIQLFYVTRGYLNATISKHIEYAPENETVRIVIDIDEGPQTLVSGIRFEGLTAVPSPAALAALTLQTGRPFRHYILKSDRNRLSAMIAEKGYPYVQVASEVAYDPAQTQARIDYNVSQGPPVRFGRIYITGNFRTRETVIQKALTIKPGTSFSLQEVLKSQKQLRDLSIFDSVSILPLGLREKSTTINMLVKVEEKKPYFVEIGTGFENDTGLFAHAEIGDHNLFGSNKDAWLKTEISQIGYHVESGIKAPRFLGTFVVAAFSVYAEREEKFNQNFGTRSLGATAGFGLKRSDTLSLGLNVDLEQRDTFLTDGNGAEDEALNEDNAVTEEARSIMVISPFIQYDTRDSFLRPRHGLFSLVSMDFSQGFDEPGDNFLKYEIDNRFFFTPRKSLTLACLLRAGYIHAFGDSDSVPEDQLFFLGGAKSVRGFEENLLRFDQNGDPKGGLSTVSGSLEARMDMGHHVELALFYDVGRLGDHFKDLYSGAFRDACGLGLRYVTPVGPIGLSYGYNLDRRDDESCGELYFSFGYSF